MAGKDQTVDLLVVGGGINGAGIANDAAGRGLKVALAEMADLGSATSSASSKLIHGGLRYLEHYEFRLVRESLAEREVLLAAAPHLVRPLRFVVPHLDNARPAWFVRLGLFFYDHLTWHRSLPGSRSIDLSRDPAGRVLRSVPAKAFEYYDCRTDDARLVVLNAKQAAGNGARIMTRTRFAGAERVRGVWQARLEDTRKRRNFTLKTRAIANVAGPWVQSVSETVRGVDAEEGSEVKLVKGSHIVVPRLYEEDHAYTLQNTDGRVIFVIPFLGRYTMVGTTEVAFKGDAAKAAISKAERDYLIAAANAIFTKTVRARDIAWSFAGVRALYGSAETASAISRDYTLKLDAPPGKAPAVTVYGGKLTTYRCLAERVMETLEPHFPDMGGPWTEDAKLPGGELGAADMESFVENLAGDYPGLKPELIRALAGRHGAQARDVLGKARTMRDLGRHFGADLYQREVDYLKRREWAETAEDVLWRRTKAGLAVNSSARKALAGYMAKGRSAAVHAAS